MLRPKDPLISIIVPCFNEEDALPILIERLSSAAKTWPGRHEVICIDDGSHDSTWVLLQNQAAIDSRWRCHSFSRNFGHQAAVSAGLQKAGGDAAIVIDADLQDPPEELIRFIREWLEGYDVVYSVRESRRDPALKKLLAWGFYRVMERLATIRIPRDSGDFALLDRKVVDAINRLPEHNRYLRGLRTWVGFRQKALTFKRAARVAGRPHYTFGQSLNLAFDGVFSFSTLPLRFVPYLGLALMIGALGMAGFVFLQRVSPQPLTLGVPRISSAAATTLIAIALIGGIQLICVGILGEYLGRIYNEVKGRPAWIITESTESMGKGQ